QPVSDTIGHRKRPPIAPKEAADDGLQELVRSDRDQSRVGASPDAAARRVARLGQLPLNCATLTYQSAQWLGYDGHDPPLSGPAHPSGAALVAVEHPSLACGGQMRSRVSTAPAARARRGG